MEEIQKKARPTSIVAEVLLALVMISSAVVFCYLCLSRIAVKHEATLVLFGIIFPKASQMPVYLAIVIAIDLVTAMWFMGRYGTPGKRFDQFVLLVLSMTFGFILTSMLAGETYANELARQGVGTMQTALDTEYQQQDMKLMGSLGFYGGNLNVDGDPQIYVCRQMDSFGPFTEQILADTATQPFSQGYEEYMRFEQDGLTQVRALSVQHYQDGYWLVVKRLVRAEDLYISLDTLDDLQKFIVQMQYSRHTGSEQDMAQAYVELAGDAILLR